MPTPPDRLDDHLPLGMGVAELTHWLRGVRSWSTTAGRVQVGDTSRPLLVGQAPSRDAGTTGELAFASRSGARIRQLLGFPDDAALRAVFDVMHILPAWPGRAGKGDRFPMPVARALARRIEFGSRRVLVLGGAAHAFDIPEPLVARAQPSAPGRLIAAVPHPSYVNRWWNTPHHKREAEQFLSLFFREWVGPVPQGPC